MSFCVIADDRDSSFFGVLLDIFALDEVDEGHFEG